MVVYTLGLTVSYDLDLINLRLLVKQLWGWELSMNTFLHVTL